jgi:hypothetical protein
MITLSPQLKKFVTDLEHLVRKSGSWLVIVNDLTHTVGMSGQLKQDLTLVAGALLTVDHYFAKTKTPTV